MNQNFYEILGAISGGVALLPLVIAIVNRKYIHGYLTPIFCLLIVSVVIELTAHTFKALHISRAPVYHTYTLFEFTLVSLFYRSFFRSYINTTFINVIIVLFFIVCIVLDSSLKLQKANASAMTIEGFVFTFYCLFLFYYCLRHLLFDNLLQAPVFWINTGVLFYFTGNLILFIFSNYIIDHIDEANKYGWLWGIIHTFFNVLMNVFFSIGFWKIREK